MLTPRQRDALDETGYAVVSDLVSDSLVRAARDVICSFVDAELDRSET